MDPLKIVLVVVAIFMIGGGVAFCRAQSEADRIQAPARDVINNPPQR